MFVDSTSPIAEARVARMLLARSEGRDLHGDLFDIVQDAFVTLFENDAKVLRAWAPERGLSLANFVGLIAERTCANRLRTHKTNPYRDFPEDLVDLEARLESTSFEGEVLSRDLVLQLLELLRAELSPRGLDLFYRLFIDGAETNEVCAELHLNRDVVYAWKSRLQRLVKEKIRMLQGSSDAAIRPRARP
jgi:DNA-directed RNA polymerase specialized sigma24 family protein